MRRGTTPDYCLYIQGYDLTSCAVFVTLAQGEQKLTLTGSKLNVEYDDIENRSIVRFSLTQQNTLDLKCGNVQIQIRFVDINGNAQASNIEFIEVKPVLNEEVIGYE